MSRQTTSFLLLATSVVFVILAAVTLLPLPSSTASDLGYFALCPFAPWSTLLLLLVAAVSWAVRRHLDGQPGRSTSGG
jgi:hypothetical protein